ncbi:unnamed protein product [Larinioides sclopetarius]|uniref:Uncharacterized protein n=1 Tax=Larinioides sclopetarius TaxID=280406 RepID=A0AAV2B0M8_9ARAC
MDFALVTVSAILFFTFPVFGTLFGNSVSAGLFVIECRFCFLWKFKAPSQFVNMADSESCYRCSSPVDDRIEISNPDALDKIYEVAVRHVTELAETHLNEGKHSFISRFSEVFRNVIQENVTVKGLPWIVNKKKPSPEEEQETADALLSKLSKTIEKTAQKRKSVRQECCRINRQILQHERHNLKIAKIVPQIKLSSISGLPRPSKSRSVQSEEFLSISKDTEFLQQQIAEQAEMLSKIQQRVEFASNIAKKHDALSEILYDTGYISE